ncbi:tetratricopeptide repeat protein, partial [bacterium]
MYLPRLGAPLLWDDRLVIAFNKALEAAPSWRLYLSEDYFSFSREVTWRPLATLSYQALVGLFGLWPPPLRAPGLLLHGFNAFLLGLVLSRDGGTKRAGAAAAALFLVHPAHVETLQCVSFNEEPIALAGILGMLLLHQAGSLWPAAGSFGLALLGKETAVAGLPIVILFDAWRGGAPSLRRHRAGYVLYAVVLGAYAWVRFILLPGPGSGMDLSSRLPALERLAYSLEGAVTALRVAAFPVGLRLEYYALPPETPLGWLGWAAGALACGAAAAWLWKTLPRKDRLWPLLAVLFLLPVLNVVPTAVLSTRMMAERWLYLPLAGLCAALALAVPRRAPLWGLVVFWGACGLWRAADWSSDSRLWGSLAGVYPWSAKAWEGLGEARFREGDYPRARAAFEEALVLREQKRDRLLAHYIPTAPPGTLAWQSPALYRSEE